MKISKQPTNNILVKAHTDSEWDSCDFAIISCGGDWAGGMKKRIGTVRPLRSEIDLFSANFWNGDASFYVSKDDEIDEILSGDKEWAFVELEEGEEDKFSVPESRLERYTLVLYTDGTGRYKAYGKHNDEDFYTVELPLSMIVKSIEETETMIAGCTAFYDPGKKHLTIRVFGRDIFSGDISGHEDDFWEEKDIDGRRVDFNFLSNDDRTCPFILVAHPVSGGETDDSRKQRIPLALNLAEDIRNLLWKIGREELYLAGVDNPVCAMWRDNRGEPNEGKVLSVGYGGDNDIYLKVDDNNGGDVSIWESHGDLPDELLERVRELVIERMDERICDECGRPVFEGFILWGGEEYYCSEECLHKVYTPEEWKEMSDGPAGKEEDGNDECYRTDWWEA